MESNKLVFAGLFVGCLAAAAGGSCLAVRQNAAPVAVSQPSPDLAPPASSATKPVTESEGVIAPDAAKPETRTVDPVAPAPRPASRIVNAPASSRASSAPAPSRPANRPLSQQTSSRQPESQAASNAPASSSTPSTSSGSMWETRPSVAPSVPDYKDAEPAAPPPPPAPEFVDVTVPSDAVLGLQIERTVSSELARVEDKVE